MNDMSEHKQVSKESPPTRVMTPFEEVERLFEEMTPGGWMHRWRWPAWAEMERAGERLMPRVNVVDRDDEIVLEAELPGVKRDDVEVSVTDNSVTLKGSTRDESKEEKGDYYRCEISSGSFARTVTLPAAIDTEKVVGTFEDGVLKLTMPKISKAARRRVELA